MIKTITKLSLVCLLVFCVTTIFAQIPDASPYPVTFLTIDENGNETSHLYESMDGAQNGDEFGVNLSETVGGEVAWLLDNGVYDDNNDGIPDAGYDESFGCNWDEITTDLTGKIALVRRGGCFFSQKIYNAQEAGAIGVIVCNDDVDSPDEAIPMGGVDSAAAVVIPAILISLNTCQLIITQIDAGNTVNAEFRVSFFNTNLGPFAYGTPIDQIRPLDSIQVSLLNADPVNELFDVEVSANITEPSGAVTTLTEIVDIPSFVNFAVEFDSYLPTEIGTYTIEFTNSLTTDVLTNTFKITSDTWQMDNGVIDNFFAPSEQQFIDADLLYDIGNTYLTGSNGGIATGATFMLENAAELFTNDEDSDKFEIRLYDMDPNGDGTGPDITVANYSGFDVVGFNEYTLTGDEGEYEAITVQFESPIVLKANGQYALMVRYDGFQAGIGVPPHYAIGGNESYPYFGSLVFLEELFYGIQGDPRGVFRLHTDNFIYDNAVDIEEVLEANKLNVFPNPTNDYVNLQLDLTAPADEVRVGILDIMGKVVQTKTLNNIQNDVTKFDVSNLSSGTYFMSVVTPEGYRSVKFTVAK